MMRENGGSSRSGRDGRGIREKGRVKRVWGEWGELRPSVVERVSVSSVEEQWGKCKRLRREERENELSTTTTTRCNGVLEEEGGRGMCGVRRERMPSYGRGLCVRGNKRSVRALDNTNTALAAET